MRLAATKSKNQGIKFSLDELVRLRATAAKIELSSRKKVRSQLIGGHLSKLRGRGIDFDETRVYQAGDDIRHMHWGITARTGVPHVKLYHEERERPVFLLVDLSPGMFFGTKVAFKSYIAVQTAAILGWAAADQGDRVGGIVFSQNKHVELKPRSRKNGILPLLKSLQALNQIPPTISPTNGPSQLSRAIARLQYVAKPGSLIFILSDFLQIDKAFEPQLSRLGQHTEIILCAINDPLEMDPPPPNRYNVTDGQSVMTIDSSTSSFCHAYKERFTRQRDHLQQIIGKNRISLLQLMTNQPITESLYIGLHQSARKRK